MDGSIFPFANRVFKVLFFWFQSDLLFLLVWPKHSGRSNNDSKVAHQQFLLRHMVESLF